MGVLKPFMHSLLICHASLAVRWKQFVCTSEFSFQNHLIIIYGFMYNFKMMLEKISTSVKDLNVSYLHLIFKNKNCKICAHCELQHIVQCFYISVRLESCSKCLQASLNLRMLLPLRMSIELSVLLLCICALWGVILIIISLSML